MPIDTGAAGAEADPVVARYNVFLKPQLPEHQRLLVLQYPNRIGNGSASGGAGPAAQTPTELRIKTASGMVEVDVPLDYTSAYDRAKGVAWGTALATSTKAKAGGSHGLAGGFGVGGQQGTARGGGGRGGGGAAAAASSSNTIIEDDMGGRRAVTSSSDWAEAVRQDRVLRLQTLGGMCPPARNAEAQWMIGVFDGGNVHLTPVSSMVHLRPQLHHIDAESEVERAKHRDAGAGADGAGGGAGGAGGGAGGGSGGARGAAGPRAIHMTVKSAGADGEEIITETMADRLRGVQMEHWSRMVYVGDDDEQSWDVYDQTLFLKDPAPAPVADDGDSKKDAIKDERAAAAALKTKVPALRTAWTENDMLVAISKVERPVLEEEAAAAAAKMASRPGKGKGKVTFAEPGAAAAAGGEAITGVEVKMEAPPPQAARMRPLARPAASLAASGAAPSARSRTARARQASTKGSAMDID